MVSSMGMAWAMVGLGDHTNEILEQDPLLFTQGLKYLFWGSLLYDLSIFAAKFSALFFYVRVFNLTDSKLWWQIAIWSGFAFSIAWMVFAIFLTIFQCHPIIGAWDKSIQPAPTCVTPFDYYVPNSSTNFANDILIVLIPIPRVIQLQMKRMKKLLVIITLLLGYLYVDADDPVLLY